MHRAPYNAHRHAKFAAISARFQWDCNASLAKVYQLVLEVASWHTLAAATHLASDVTQLAKLAFKFAKIRCVSWQFNLIAFADIGF